MQRADEAAPVRRIAESLETKLLIIVSHADPKIVAQYKLQMDEMRRKLGADSFGDPLEMLLIERIVLTWARLQFIEEQSIFKYLPNTTEAACEYWDRRLDHAHERFQKSCVALARVRKLQRRQTPGEMVLGDLLGNTLTSGLRKAGKLLAGRMSGEMKGGTGR
jgi:hypothetical protein